MLRAIITGSGKYKKSYCQQQVFTNRVYVPPLHVTDQEMRVFATASTEGTRYMGGRDIHAFGIANYG